MNFVMRVTAKWRSGILLAAIAIWSNALTVVTYGQWINGLSTNDDYFPIGVWLQAPADAAEWLAAGVNLYTGLWEGPTGDQLDALHAAGMQTIATQNSTALAYTKLLSDGRPVIVGWLMEDEPDNDQPNGSGGYGPPIPTATIQQAYQQYKTNDPTRPIFLNLSQGLGWDSATWYGQGGYINPDTNYPQYILGSDIISFDIYPMASSGSAVAGGAWRVALGVDRLRQYAPSNHIIWCFIETGDIHGTGHEATITQIKAEVWMAIIHGATGINYFIHGKTSVSDFDSRALLESENATRLAGVTEINNEVHSLAAVLKSPSITGLANMTNLVGTNEVDFMVKQPNGATCLFAVGMSDAVTTKGFQFQNLTNEQMEVIGENRTVTLTNGSFSDTFNGYEAHLYSMVGADTNRLSISVEPPNATLFWNSATGVSYTIQYKKNLNQIPWLFLGTMDGSEGTTTFTDTNPFTRNDFTGSLFNNMPLLGLRFPHLVLQRFRS
jgi:hypothetical protein